MKNSFKYVALMDTWYAGQAQAVLNEKNVEFECDNILSVKKSDGAISGVNMVQGGLPYNCLAGQTGTPCMHQVYTEIRLGVI